MSQNIENMKLKFTIFDRRQPQRNKIMRSFKHLERKDFFDIQAEQWKYLSNSGPIDKGSASRLVPSVPLIWRSLLPKDFIIDVYGDQDVHKLDDIMRNVSEMTWSHIPLNGELLIQKYINAIAQQRHKAYLTNTPAVQPMRIGTTKKAAPLPIATKQVVGDILTLVEDVKMTEKTETQKDEVSESMKVEVTE